MKLDQIIKPPRETSPRSRFESYAKLVSRIADEELSASSRSIAVSRQELIRIYAIRAQNTPIEHVEEFLSTLEELDDEFDISGVGFDFSEGAALVITDEQGHYVTHVIKKRGTKNFRN